jgi:predicted Rdx family selenoprotein
LLHDYQHLIDTFTLVTGTKGVFDVDVDGELIFSKTELGRHAEPDEVLALFKEFVGPNIDVYPRS